MRIASDTRMAALPLLLAALTSHVFTQTTAPPAPAGPTFDVVSIKRNTTGNTTAALLATPRPVERPDGGFRFIRTSVVVLMNRAFPQFIGSDRVGLPGWATTDYYDVIATSTLTRATTEDRIAMMRAMLAERFKLAAHFEKREQPVYDLVLARRDGRLGSGLTRLDVDCDVQLVALRAAAEAARNAGTPPPSPPALTEPPPQCTLRTIGAVIRDMRGDKLGRLGDLMEGDASMTSLAAALRPYAGRSVVNKTGLAGSYRVKMNFDSIAVRRGPDTAPPPDAAPSVFTALPEQLGLKLESSQESHETLVVDRLERPTED